MTQRQQWDPLHWFTGWGTASSIAMIALGFLAFLLPRAAGVSLADLAGLLLIGAWLAHMIYAFAAWGPGAFVWRSLVGSLYGFVGVYLVAHPEVSLAGLALGLAIFLGVEGVVALSLAVSMFTATGAGWLLLDSILAILFSVLIWVAWPANSLWLLGTLLGIKLIVSGMTRLLYAANSRRAVAILVRG